MKILFFYTDWCTSCDGQFYLVNEILGDYAKIEKVNLETNRSDAQKYSVRNIPCVVILDKHDDVLIDRIEGVKEPFQWENLKRDLFGGS